MLHLGGGGVASCAYNPPITASRYAGKRKTDMDISLLSGLKTPM